MVADYCNTDINSAFQLPCDEFQLALKNAYIAKLESTEEGREYLEKCKRLKTTKIDEIRGGHLCFAGTRI